MELVFSDIAILENGDMPLILSSHHDGQLTGLNGREFPVVRNVENDIGVNRLSRGIADMAYRLNLSRPFLFTYIIRKDRSTEEMFDKYVQKVFQVAKHCLSIWGKCAVLDLHRFYKHPESPDGSTYDIWFGTDHRSTVRDDFDLKLAQRLHENYRFYFSQALQIYVPEEKPKDWQERFGATGKHTLILTKALGEKFSGQNLSAIQLEFYKDLFFSEANFVKLAIALALALGEI